MFLRILLLFPIFCLGQQNLVPNPSFENIKYAPHNFTMSGMDFTTNMAHWSSPTNGSPDIVTPEFRPKNIYLNGPYAKTGKVMAGLSTSRANYAEYIRAKLIEKVKKDHTYKVEFSYLLLANEKAKPVYNNPNFGITFYQGQQFNISKYLGAEPQVAPSDTAHCQPNTWKTVSASFTADQDYSHICIGQFQPEGDAGLFSYLLIDDVSIVQTNTPKLEAGATVVLENVNFKSGTAILESNSFTALNELYQILQNNNVIKIAIHGHTDDVGNEEQNLKLSEQRAKAVYDYLIQKGISNQRLKFQGFGEEFPIANNKDSSGRKKNRRVEFKVE